MKVHIDLTDAESKVLIDLSDKLDLSPNQVMRQALRQYQSVQKGSWTIIEVNPLSMMCPHENVISCPGEEYCKDCGEILWRD